MTISPNPSFLLCRRRARERSSWGFRPPVSSMYSGALCKAFIAPVILSHSSSFRCAVRRRWESTRAEEASIRMASCEPPISMENTPTGKPSRTATCSATLSAKAVFPIDGRPATTIRSPGCNPDIFSSISAKPVAMPVMLPGLSLSYSSCVCSITCTSRALMCVKLSLVRAPFSVISKIRASASSSNSWVSEPCGFSALAAISSEMAISLRRMARSRTISA